MVLQQATSFAHDYGPSIATMCGLIFNGLLIYGGIRQSKGQGEEALRALSQWRLTHQEEADQRDESLAQLREIAASTKALAQGQETRLKMVEDEMRDNRRAKRGGS